MWHYEITAEAIAEVLRDEMGEDGRFFGYVSSTGSAGTLAAGDKLKELYPASKIIACEALQCPTLLRNGFGGHRIEGIGDKHVPWIHNSRNTDMIVAVDDNDPMALIRLFNEDVGKEYLKEQGINPELVEKLELLGISSIGNVIAAIKAAKHYELDENDVLFTIFTDSMEMYQSRLQEANEANGEYTKEQAAIDWAVHMHGVKTDSMQELGHWDKRQIHNLKYYTWIEQQQKELDEINAQWDNYKTYWPERWRMAGKYDELIGDFNTDVGILKKYEG